MNAMQDAVIFLLNVVIEHNPTSAHANDAMRKVENIFAEEDENEKKLVDAINARITEQAEKASSFGAHRDEKDPSFGGQDASPAGVGPTNLEEPGNEAVSIQLVSSSRKS